MSAKVRRTTADGRTVVLFEGRDEDAHAHVVNNFPRPHVEPGSVPDRLRADVHVLTDGGDVYEYHGEDGGWVQIKDDQIVNDDELVDDDDEPNREAEVTE